MQSGIVIINKPTGVTSRFVVDIVGKYFKTKKVGHTGTLDPMASGVLIVCVNQATKLVNFLTSKNKEYFVELELGYETDTLDNTGNVTYTQDLCINPKLINEVILSFKKTYMQEVPLYSAVKVNGKKCYEYARNNEMVELPKKEVTIENTSDIQILGKKISFKCSVTKGTYVRSLVRDIGRALNSYATMTSLVRTKHGNFNIEQAQRIDDELTLMQIEDLFLGYPIIKVTNEEIIKYKNGVVIDNNYNSDYLVIKHKNALIAIYESFDDNKLKPLVIIKD